MVGDGSQYQGFKEVWHPTASNVAPPHQSSLTGNPKSVAAVTCNIANWMSRAFCSQRFLLGAPKLLAQVFFQLHGDWNQKFTTG
jgi:hypothetical protein